MVEVCVESCKWFMWKSITAYIDFNKNEMVKIVVLESKIC